MHGVSVFHCFVVPLQDVRGGHVFWRGVVGGGLVPEGEGVDGMGGVELLEGHLREANTEEKRKKMSCGKCKTTIWCGHAANTMHHVTRKER